MMSDIHETPVKLSECWYCGTIEGMLRFSWEFDCFVHLECISSHLKEYPDDMECLLFAREFATSLGLDGDVIDQRIDKLFEPAD